MSDNTSDPARIERDLDQTRSRLGSHLNELQDRLSPGQVLDDLMGYFRGSEGAEFGRSLLANVRDNPMPAALTGIGLAWLMASNPRAGTSSASATEWEQFGKSGPHLYGREDYGATMVRVRDAERGVSRLPDEAEHDYSARLDDARGQAIGLARHTQESAESFGARVRDALSSAQEAVAKAASGARDQVGSAVNAAGNAVGSLTASAQGTAQGALRSATGALSQGGQASSNLVAALTESPVLLGALGLAAGALLGALLPQSDQEEAALGDIAGQARDAATDLAKEGLERGKHVAQTVADKARESAGHHGLTGDRTAGQVLDAALSGELAVSATEVARDVLDKSDEAVRTEMGSSSTAPGPSSPGLEQPLTT